MADNGWRIDMSGAPRSALNMERPAIGDVYKKAGGRLPGFWVVVAIEGEAAHVLAFDANGKCTGAQNYRTSYFWENAHRKVGVAVNLPETLAIQWIEP